VLGKVPLKYNARNLAVRWQTTLLTGLAFTLVVGLMTWMLAFVAGMYKLTQGSAQPANVVVLSDGATDEAFSNLGYGDVRQVELRDGVLRDEENKPLVSWEVYTVVNQPVPNARPGGRQRRFIQVRGIEDPVRSGRVHGLALHPGGAWFSQAGVQALSGPSGEQAIQVVLGEGIARELGPDLGKPSLQVGDIFDMADRRWAVVGVMQSAGSTFDSEIWPGRRQERDAEAVGGAVDPDVRDPVCAGDGYRRRPGAGADGHERQAPAGGALRQHARSHSYPQGRAPVKCLPDPAPCRRNQNEPAPRSHEIRVITMSWPFFPPL
jgi:hypothetical protein